MGRTWNLLEAHRPALEQLAARLCADETLEGGEGTAIVAGTLSLPVPA